MITSSINFQMEENERIQLLPNEKNTRKRETVRIETIPKSGTHLSKKIFEKLQNSLNLKYQIQHSKVLKEVFYNCPQSKI